MTTSAHARAEQAATRELERLLRPSGALLAAQAALGRAIQDLAVARTDHDATTLDLLIRLRLAPDQQLRGVDLCRHLLRSPSHVSRMIDRVESDGLVERLADPDDRRAQRITLTDAGRQAVDQFTPRLTDVLERTIHATLTADEIDGLIDLLMRISVSAHQLIDHQRRANDSDDTKPRP